MSEHVFDVEDLERLKQWDTPTICNGLELIVPQRQSVGFTVEQMVAAHRSLPPIVGLARVGTVRSSKAAGAKVANLLDWVRYVADAEMPTVVVLEDIDDNPGYGAFWGEVNSLVHRSLGAQGCVTNGSFRDCDMLAPGFQILGGRIGPSHAHVHLVDLGQPVNVFGMQAGHNDVIHADYHGAVVIPAEAVRKLPDAIQLVARREKVILDVCNDPTFTVDMLVSAIRSSAQIH
ncbi:RraA family protein [Mesorhizobium sp. CAU 1732]|uniref:RraA family protein n=1 Tax=Mesorhizobium sp. CAU 1732 TaxID=3140358 RepID=UPI003261BCA0